MFMVVIVAGWKVAGRKGPGCSGARHVPAREGSDFRRNEGRRTAGGAHGRAQPAWRGASRQTRRRAAILPQSAADVTPFPQRRKLSSCSSRLVSARIESVTRILPFFLLCAAAMRRKFVCRSFLRRCERPRRLGSFPATGMSRNSPPAALSRVTKRFSSDLTRMRRSWS